MLLNSTLHNLIEDNSALFSLPKIVVALNKLVDDPNSSIEQIAELISQDAALTMRLLKIVNSSYYNFSSNIDTISNAINIIGTRELNDFVMATKLVDKFNNCPMRLLSAEDFWLHNLACATAVRVISAELNIKNVERLFVAGLIHDIGKLLMYVSQPKLCELIIKKMRSHPRYVDQIELKVFGYSHEDVGSALVKQWGLPEILVITTQYHHHPEQTSNFVVEVALIHLANAIANLLEKPLSYDDTLPIHNSVWETLGINDHHLVLLTHATELKYRDIPAILIK